jgi:hypothetical protein
MKVVSTNGVTNVRSWQNGAVRHEGMAFMNDWLNKKNVTRASASPCCILK